MENIHGSGGKYVAIEIKFSHRSSRRPPTTDKIELTFAGPKKYQYHKSNE